jgi:hypothetical protein
MAMYLGEDKVANGGFIGDYDSLPVGSVIEFDGDGLPLGYEEIDNIVTNGRAVKTGRRIGGKDEYVKRISTVLGAGVKNSNNLHWDILTGLTNVTATRNIDAFVTNSNGAVLDCNMVRFNGTSLSGTSQQAYFTTSTGIIAFETAGNDRQGLEFTANIYFTYN